MKVAAFLHTVIQIKNFEPNIVEVSELTLNLTDKNGQISEQGPFILRLLDCQHILISTHLLCSRHTHLCSILAYP